MSKGRPDGVIASEAWRRYLLRNDSALVDRCFGQLKSHVTCTHCGNESVTFDAYSSLSLPLPVRNTKPVSVVVQLLPLGSLPVKLVLDVDVTAVMSQLQGILTAKLTELGLLSTSPHAHSSTASMTATSVVTSIAQTEMDHDNNNNNTDTGSESGATTTTSMNTHSPQAIDAYEMVEVVEVVSIVPGELSLRMDDDECVTAFNTEDTKMEPVTPLSPSLASYSTACASPVPITDASTSPRTSPTNPTSAPASTSMTTAADGKVYFQFGTLFSSRPASVFKSYNAAEHGGTSITSFITRNDSLMAFQLEHRAPEFRSMSYSYSNRAPTKYDAADQDCGFVAVDVVMGTKETSYIGAERVDLAGYPLRIVLPVECTNRYVLRKLQLITQRYLRDTDTDTHTETHTHSDINSNNSNNSDNNSNLPALADLPYTVLVTNAYGSVVKRTVPLNDEVFQVPAGGTDVLAVGWPSKFGDCMDEEQLTAVRAVGEVDASSPKSKGNKHMHIRDFPH